MKRTYKSQKHRRTVQSILIYTICLLLFLSCLPASGCSVFVATTSLEQETSSREPSSSSSEEDSEEVQAHASSVPPWDGAKASQTVFGEEISPGLRKLRLEPEEAETSEDSENSEISLWLYPLSQKLLVVRAGPLGWGGMVQARLTVYDPYTGEETAQARLTLNGMDALQVSGETVSIWQNGEVFLYDADLHTIGKYTVSVACEEYWVSPEGSRIYCMDGEGNCLFASLTEQAQGQELVFSPTFSWYYDTKIVKKVNGGAQLIIQGIDPQSLKREYYAADAESGRVLGTLGQYPLKEAAYSAGRNGQKGSYLLSYETAGGSGERAYSAVSVEGESFSTGRELLSGKALIPVDKAGVYLSADQKEGECAFSCYSPDGSFLASARFHGKVFFSGRGETVWLQEGACLAAVYEDEEGSGILFWSPGEQESSIEGENLALKKAPAIPEGELSPLYERAAAMGRRFGVEIQIGEWVDLTPVGYEISPTADYRTLEDGLDKLEEAMERYPEGFFRQLCYGDMQGMKIALTGGLVSGADSGYPTKADGYVTQAENFLEMALSLEDVYYLPSVFYHETAHLIDKRIAFDALYDVTSPFSEEEWNHYNPEGFFYDMSYSGERKLKQEDWGAYFLNSYSLTYPTEDRAELMKDAMSQDPVWAGAKSIRTSPQLQEKFQYYCLCIRSAFDTEDWPETTAWEEVLRQGREIQNAA